MWDIVGNLGIKDGIQEFREQFSKDAKVTIANSTFAKNRGLDVAALDDLEMNLENKLHQQTAELHARTVGAAVKTIARDETLAQLLDVKCSREVPCESDELDFDLSQSVDSIDSPFAGDATGACEAQHLGHAREAEGAYGGSSSAPLRDRFSPPSAAVLDSVHAIQAGGHDSPESPKHAQQPHLLAGSSVGSSAGNSARRADENARRLEEEVARITAANKVTPLAVPPSMPTACRRSLASNSFDPDQDSGPDIGTYVLGDDESDTFCIDEDGCDSFASVQVDLDNLSVPCETACEACGGQPDSQGSFSVARPDSCRLRQAELEVGSDNGLLIFLGDVIDDRRDGQDGGRYLPLRHLELELFYLGDITLDNALPLGGLEAMCQQECDPEAEVVYLGVVMDDRCSKGGTDCCSRGPAKVAKCDREWDWTLGEDCSEVVFLGEDFGRRTSLTVRVNRVHLGEEDMSSCRLMLSSWEDRDVGSLPLSEAAGTDLICLGLTEKNFCVNDISDEASLLDFMQGPAARREPKILSEAVPS